MGMHQVLLVSGRKHRSFSHQTMLCGVVVVVVVVVSTVQKTKSGSDKVRVLVWLPLETARSRGAIGLGETTF